MALSKKGMKMTALSQGLKPGSAMKKSIKGQQKAYKKATGGTTPRGRAARKRKAGGSTERFSDVKRNWGW